MDPCDDDDTAASTADVLPVSVMERLQLCYSDMDAFLHVDLFHPPHCQSPATGALPPCGCYTAPRSEEIG